jgi:hypothetical protein
MKRPRSPLPRYVRRKWLPGEKAWAYFFEVPTWAKRQGCPVTSEALGTDYAAACSRAEDVLLPQLDSWRTGGRSDLVPERAAPGTFDWLVKVYQGSRKYTKLPKAQKRLHKGGFSLVGNHVLKDGRRFGALPLASITSAVADKLYEKLLVVVETAEDGTTTKRERRTHVNHAMKSCRRAWNVTRRAEPTLVPQVNPFAKMGLEDASKKTPTADYAELTAFVAACDASGMSSLGTATMVTWEWLQREEHVFGKLLVEHYRPKDRPDEVLVVHPKNDEAVWLPLFEVVHEGGRTAKRPLFPELMARLDAIKRGRIGGVMIVRDWIDETAGVPVPWITRSGDLTYMRHRTKAMVRAAALRDELTFTSFRHGGMTELGDADLSDTQIRTISRHKDPKTLPRYVKATRRQLIAGTKKRRQVRTERGDLSE